MGKKKPENRKVIRNRRVMIYTFLLIFMLLYISAHFTVQERKAAEAEQRAEAVTVAAVEIREEKLMQESSDRNAPAGELKEGGSMEETADGGSAESKGLVINPEDMWCLILTNAEYPVPEDYTVTLKDVPGTDQTVDERIYEPLMKMLEAMKAEGLSPVVCSGYRTLDKQEKLFNRKVSSYVKKGHSKEEANALARQTLSIPGSGEHDPTISWNGRLRGLPKGNGCGNMRRIMDLPCVMRKEKRKSRGLDMSRGISGMWALRWRSI